MSGDKKKRSALVRRVEETRNNYMAAVKSLSDFDSASFVAAHKNYTSINTAYWRAVREAHKMQSPLTFDWYTTS